MANSKQRRAKAAALAELTAGDVLHLIVLVDGRVQQMKEARANFGPTAFPQSEIDRWARILSKLRSAAGLGVDDG